MSPPGPEHQGGRTKEWEGSRQGKENWEPRVGQSEPESQLGQGIKGPQRQVLVLRIWVSWRQGLNTSEAPELPILSSSFPSPCRPGFRCLRTVRARRSKTRLLRKPGCGGGRQARTLPRALRIVIWNQPPWGPIGRRRLCGLMSVRKRCRQRGRTGRRKEKEERGKALAGRAGDRCLRSHTVCAQLRNDSYLGWPERDPAPGEAGRGGKGDRVRGATAPSGVVARTGPR